ncbi:MAG: TetR/AcrR family transcriptional regulator [Myxococcota bacterium]
MRTLKRAPGTTDGRVRRSEKSRQAIADAMFELVGGGVLQPTAQQVAERAGVGIRSVFRHFDDMEGLFAAMDARLRSEVVPLLREIEPEGALERRAGDLVERRVRLFERIAPYKRSANLARARSPFLRARHGALVRELRENLLHWLPEFERAPADLVEAVDLATSFEAWDRLRSDQRLSRERAHAALERIVLALVDDLVAGRKR